MRQIEYIVVHFLRDQPVGSRFLGKRNAWPLHITLLTWFVSEDPEDTYELIRQSSGHSSPLLLRVGKTVDFDAATRVSVIADQEEVAMLHAAYLATVRNAGGVIKDTRWIGDDYTAHITHHDTALQPLEGDMVPLDDCSLVKLLPDNMCEVVGTFKIGNLR